MAFNCHWSHLNSKNIRTFFTMECSWVHAVYVLVDTLMGLQYFGSYSWASAAGGKGAVAPLDFHTWYKYSRKRLKIAIFGVFAIFWIFCYFSVFFSLRPPILSPGNFFADALNHIFNKVRYSCQSHSGSIRCLMVTSSLLVEVLRKIKWASSQYADPFSCTSYGSYQRKSCERYIQIFRASDKELVWGHGKPSGPLAGKVL